MASDQVSSELSKKEELREAGRRRLEEFRKKKGTKKSVGTSQPLISNSEAAEKPTYVHAPTPSESAGPAYRMTDAVTAASGFSGNTGKEHGFAHISGSEIDPQEHVTFQIGDGSSPDLPPVLPKQVVSQNDVPDLGYQKSSIYEHKSNNSISSFETDIGNRKHEVAISLDRRGGLQDDSNSNFYSHFYGGDKDINSQTLSNSNVSTKTFAEGRVTHLLRQHDVPESVHPKSNYQTSTLELGHNQHEPEFKNYLTSDTDERGPSDTVGSLFDFSSQLASEPLSDGLNFDSHIAVDGILSSTGAETYVRRSRPSFLDSLNIDRDFHSSGRASAEQEKFTTSKLLSSNYVAPSWVQEPTTPTPVEPLPTPVYSNTNSTYYGNGFMGRKMLDNIETKVEFSSHKQNEDFAALEQHIEDLTQEKFSLQRAMEASEVLAESLAAENSSLTESYNQQASIVSQLKAEMERLQEEIKARLVELEAMKAEFTNAHLECNAADERAKLLASEVINIEEKVRQVIQSMFANDEGASVLQ